MNLRRRWLRWLLALAAAALVLAIAGTGAGMALEENDTFCASCHTQPEVTFVARSTDRSQEPGVDLAARHALLDKGRVQCIGCHSGQTLPGRVWTVWTLGARDTLKWVSGRYNRPGQTHFPIQNPNCERCHGDAAHQPGFNNHFHNLLYDPKAPPILCVACHPSHDAGADPRKFYVRDVAVYPTCNSCHTVMGGPILQ